MKPRLKASATLHLQGPEGLKGSTLHLKGLKGLKVKPRLKGPGALRLQVLDSLIVANCILRCPRLLVSGWLHLVLY